MARYFSAAAVLEGMDAPSALFLECPNCGRTPHRVIRGRLSRGREIVVEGVVRCTTCGFTRRETYRELRPLDVRLIISQGENSERSSLELSSKELVRVGDRFDMPGGQVEVTAIEVEDRRVTQAAAEEVGVLWSKRVDRVPVKFSVNKGRKTLAFTLHVPPDEEFEVGELVELGGERAVIHRIKRIHGVLLQGAARAEDIQRVYCKAVRGRWSGHRGGSAEG